MTGARHSRMPLWFRLALAPGGGERRMLPLLFHFRRADHASRLNELPAWTDHYSCAARRTVQRFGDKRVTYAVFMPAPLVRRRGLCVEWLQAVAKGRAHVRHRACSIARASGSAPASRCSTSPAPSCISGYRTIFLMKALAPRCVRRLQCLHDVPTCRGSASLAHGPRAIASGTEIGGADGPTPPRYGSERAKLKSNAQGLHRKPLRDGRATSAVRPAMGYHAAPRSSAIGSTVRAAEMSARPIRTRFLTVLRRLYFGREVRDARRLRPALFPILLCDGRLAGPRDTPGQR